ncbi:hypothetical protein K431DRAFT_284553 [Polychaeton citri CBS 116435]|uniref:IBR domain-containing protein n=1 Tax=Polychaeton citri CBS 116435 TaxID=1314669 RepID=A0A9P4UPJ9_9PEZI|nr:hypothetical protein K431DRAFT_284553 [Polychaeton citri CBS 116435]
MACPSSSSECAVCALDIPLGEKHRHIQSYCICENCSSTAIKELLEKSLEHEINFPPVFGEHIINFKDFSDLLRSDYGYRYRVAHQERNTPHFQRIYCSYRVHEAVKSCGKFLGQMWPPDPDPSEVFGLMCRSCKIIICRLCVQSFNDLVLFRAQLWPSPGP